MPAPGRRDGPGDLRAHRERPALSRPAPGGGDAGTPRGMEERDRPLARAGPSGKAKRSPRAAARRSDDAGGAGGAGAERWPPLPVSTWPASPPRTPPRAGLLRRSGSPAATRARWRYLTAQRDRRADLRDGLPVGALGRLRRAAVRHPAPVLHATSAPDRGWIARYAWGDDYHDVLKALLERPSRAHGGRARAHRVARLRGHRARSSERAYAAAAGLGAWGKNTCLLHPEHGSWFFLGEVVTDLDLSRPTRRASTCAARCTACLEACPTGALVRALRARRDALHQLPDDRDQGRDPGGPPRRSRPPRLRLRHLPGRVPVEPASDWRKATPVSPRARV